MFIKISCINTHSESAIRLIDTDQITLVGEQHQEPTRLYDSVGNLVSETPATEKKYFVLFKDCGQVIVDQTNYDTIEKALLK